MRQFLLRIALSILWSRGGSHDSVDGLPRVLGADVAPVVPQLEPGDLILCGNNGGLSHVAVHVGDGTIIHSMATEKTMRGTLGALWEGIRALFGRTGELTGVLEETFGGFLDRYERDTWVVLRHKALDPQRIGAGIDKIRGLVGEPYDYDFDRDDNDYYCTEIAIDFLAEALGSMPEFETRTVRVPLLLNTQVVEPLHLMSHPDLEPVLANEAAEVGFPDRIRKATVWTRK